MLKLNKNNLTIILLTSISMSALADAPTAPAVNSTSLVFTGESIQALSDNHFRVKVSFHEASKMRCVGFADEKSVAIDSTVVFPPYGVANMIISDKDAPINRVQCWVTSTREADLKRDYIRHNTTGS